MSCARLRCRCGTCLINECRFCTVPKPNALCLRCIEGITQVIVEFECKARQHTSCWAQGSTRQNCIWASMSIFLLMTLCCLLQAQKAENIMEHEAEIYARPARTWFQTERQKRQAAKEAREAATSAPDIQAAVKGVAARKGSSQGGAAATGKKGKLTKQEQQALRVKKNTFMEVGLSFLCQTLP